MMQSPDLLPNTSEIGSLTANSNDESHFVGSSSGVFFVNTVRQAFARSLGSMQTAPTPEFPAPEDTLVGSSSPVRGSVIESKKEESRTKWTYDAQIAQYLGEAPALEHARELMMTYFKIWHPLFPFLHGPSFLQAMEAFHWEGSASDELSNAASEHYRACWTTIFQCVFNISSLLRPDLRLAQKASITSATHILKLANVLLDRNDILSLQAILAIQLYLVANMSIRNASLLGGTILRAILHAGFHRCPFQYQQLSAHDCQLRKRIFWCFYAIDRYLSQALGLPLGIQDSDIDVCRPNAPEIHTPRNPRSVPSKSPLPADASVNERNGNFQYSSLWPPSQKSRRSSEETFPNREATLASFVAYGELTGRALELFHKSTHSREIRRSTVLYLVSDVHKWWNNLPSTLQNVSGDSAESSGYASPEMGPLFPILYKHLILCINRPYLSLDPSSPDFCSGLQICIDAARSILSLLNIQLTKGQAFFLPSLLSAAYMAGLVIAFACQLGQYSISKGCQEIRDCLNILQAMCGQWEIARHCHTVLSILLLNIQRQESPGSKRVYQSGDEPTTPSGRSKKRKTIPAILEEDHLTYDSLGIRDYQTQDSNDSTVALPTDAPQHNGPSAMYNTNLHPFSETTTTTTTQIYDEAGADDTNITPSETSILALPNHISNETTEELQQLGESSFLTTNFDLNMTDLFQNSSWDSILFDAFNNEE